MPRRMTRRRPHRLGSDRNVLRLCVSASTSTLSVAVARVQDPTSLPNSHGRRLSSLRQNVTTVERGAKRVACALSAAAGGATSTPTRLGRGTRPRRGCWPRQQPQSPLRAAQRAEISNQNSQRARISNQYSQPVEIRNLESTHIPLTRTDT